MGEIDTRLYPNRDSGESRQSKLARRTVLAGSAALGATAGCLGTEPAESGKSEVTARPTVFVFNTGDGTVSLVDVETDAVVETVAAGLTASFPANQFAPGLTDQPEDVLWLNVDEGVRAVTAGQLDERATVETGSGANWQELTPDGDHLVVSAREPAHRQVRIAADPGDDAFGTVTGELDRTDEGGRGDHDGPGPCDVTIHPDGRYAYVPDLFGDTLTVIDVESFEIVRQVAVSGRDGMAPEPWMGTAGWEGERLLVEHNDGAVGSESIWDVSDPADPVALTRLTTDDGLGESPLTSEIGPESAFGYVFTPGTEDVTVIDLTAGEVADRLDLGGAAFTGTWNPDRSKLYVPIQTTDEVAVIDAAAREFVDTLAVGPSPYGATAATVRGDPEEYASTGARIARLTGDYDTTYCLDECACGHTW